MRPSYSALIVIATIAISAFLSPNAIAALSFISPPDKAAVDSELINVILKVDKAALDSVAVSVRNRRNRKPISFKLKVERDIICYDGITLRRGLNRIKVTGLKEGKIVEEKEVDLFYRIARSKRYQRAPSDFKKNYFHIPENEELCSPCHQMEPSEIDKEPPDPEKSSCFTCHKKVVSYDFVHGPASTWSCLSCHNSEARDWKYSVVKPDSESCFMCHEETMKLWNTKKYRHGPTLVSCTVCHNPHASDEPFWVRTHATRLCLSCHEGKASGAHVIAGFGGKGHPTKGRPDPNRPGREFTCAGCHNPHADDSPNLLYYDNTSYTYFCTVCHKR